MCLFTTFRPAFVRMTDFSSSGTEQKMRQLRDENDALRKQLNAARREATQLRKEKLRLLRQHGTNDTHEHEQHHVRPVSSTSSAVAPTSAKPSPHLAEQKQQKIKVTELLEQLQKEQAKSHQLEEKLKWFLRTQQDMSELQSSLSSKDAQIEALRQVISMHTSSASLCDLKRLEKLAHSSEPSSLCSEIDSQSQSASQWSRQYSESFGSSSRVHATLSQKLIERLKQRVVLLEREVQKLQKRDEKSLAAKGKEKNNASELLHSLNNSETVANEAQLHTTIEDLTEQLDSSRKSRELDVKSLRQRFEKVEFQLRERIDKLKAERNRLREQVRSHRRPQRKIRELEAKCAELRLFYRKKVKALEKRSEIIAEESHRDSALSSIETSELTPPMESMSNKPTRVGHGSRHFKEVGAQVSMEDPAAFTLKPKKVECMDSQTELTAQSMRDAEIRYNESMKKIGVLQKTVDSLSSNSEVLQKLSQIRESREHDSRTLLERKVQILKNEVHDLTNELASALQSCDKLAAENAELRFQQDSTLDRARLRSLLQKIEALERRVAEKDALLFQLEERDGVYSSMGEVSDSAAPIFEAPIREESHPTSSLASIGAQARSLLLD
ncbi:MAG: hypothetical protein MHM6MM_004903 [Cercozoa sp. M6MM]